MEKEVFELTKCKVFIKRIHTRIIYITLPTTVKNLQRLCKTKNLKKLFRSLVLACLVLHTYTTACTNKTAGIIGIVMEILLVYPFYGFFSYVLFIDNTFFIIWKRVLNSFRKIPTVRVLLVYIYLSV